MFALMVSEDRISMSARRKEIMKGLHELPGKVDTGVKSETFQIVINIMAPVRLMHHNRAKHHLRAIHSFIHSLAVYPYAKLSVMPLCTVWTHPDLMGRKTSEKIVKLTSSNQSFNLSISHLLVCLPHDYFQNHMKIIAFFAYFRKNREGLSHGLQSESIS